MLAERIEPLRALLYDQQQIGDLAQVVAPPYDLIGQECQNELYARSPYNVVRLELGREADRYRTAAQTLADWRQRGILRLAPRPAIYLYTQVFALEGRHFRREGLMARIRLEEFGLGRILPHEHTFASAKEDRLKLLTATRTNVSPVFGLYAGEHPELAALLERVRSREPIARVVEPLGVEDSLRVIDDRVEIQTIQRELAAPQILIADGHHRYETALNYRKLCRAAEREPAGLQPYDYTLITLVAHNHPGLVILPTHRIVRGLKAETMDAFAAKAGEHFEVEEAGRADALRAELVRRGQGTFGVSLRTSPTTWLLTLKNRHAMETALPNTPEALRHLDVSVLHALVLEGIFGIEPEQVSKGGNIEYTTDAKAALDAVEAANADGAFLMNPPTIRDVERVSNSGATMPEKSTYFYPKLLTGLVLNPLDVV